MTVKGKVEQPLLECCKSFMTNGSGSFWMSNSIETCFFSIETFKDPSAEGVSTSSAMTSVWKEV